jgi:hypothetical protein
VDVVFIQLKNEYACGRSYKGKGKSALELIHMGLIYATRGSPFCTGVGD